MRRHPRRTRRRPSRPSHQPEAHREGERLQKVLAAAGIGSRRQCEELILAGRVEVDRCVVTQLGTRVDPRQREIRVDGIPLRRHQRVYYAVNKPAGVVSTHRDPSGRPRVVDLMPSAKERLFTVGRLDLHSEGLILLTNDGDLAQRLAHPRYAVQKTYRVWVAGRPGEDLFVQLRRGVHLAEGVARVAKVRTIKPHRASTLLEIALQEGRNREIRRLMARLGHKVLRLTRIAVGPIRLGKLPVGAHRRLTSDEVAALRRCCQLDRPRRPPANA